MRRGISIRKRSRPNGFAFGGHIYRRQIDSSGDWRLAVVDASAEEAIREGAFIDSEALDAAARKFAPAISLKPYDIYATALGRPGALVFRVVCGDV
jgi:hypothetical protein